VLRIILVYLERGEGVAPRVNSEQVLPLSSASI
jgi:hypothetical protein